MQQGNLFDDDGDPSYVPPCDPNARDEDKPRLSKQCLVILDMLREKPRTNDELSRVSRKYTSWISDLRISGGHSITARHVKDGLWVYTLEEQPCPKP